MSGAPVSLGRIYARLCDETHDWNAEADRVDDLPHFGITISEEEGEFPVLEVAFENAGVGVDALVGGRERILLSIDRLDADLARVDTILLFDGVLDDTGDVELGSEDVTLRYEARRANWQALRDAVLAGVGLPFADPCAGDLSDPVERLDGIPALVCWDRTTRQPILSSAVNGGGGVDRNIGRNHRQGTCRVIRNGRPLGRVDVVISAEWTQCQIGEFDVGEKIVEQTGYGALASMTPDKVVADWFRPGDQFGDYVVSDASIEPISPPPDVDPLIAVLSQAVTNIRAYRAGAQEPQQFRMTSGWYRPHLKIAAASEFKRREEVRFSVFNGGQGASTDFEKVEINLDNLTLVDDLPEWEPGVHYSKGTLIAFAGFVWIALEPHDSDGASMWVDREREDEEGNVERLWDLVLVDGSPLGSRAAPSFFNSERGRQSIDHGIAVAMQRLAYSQRSYTIDIEVDALSMLEISCRDTVRVVSDRIPGVGGEAVGKVRSYTFRFSASEATCIISLAVSTGSGQAGGTGDKTVSFGPSWSRIAYSPPAYLAPSGAQMGIVSVNVQNDAQKQIELLRDGMEAGTLGSPQHAFDIIDRNPTWVNVTVLPVGGGESFVPITVDVSSFQGFRGISL